MARSRGHSVFRDHLFPSLGIWTSFLTLIIVILWDLSSGLGTENTLLSSEGNRFLEMFSDCTPCAKFLLQTTEILDGKSGVNGTYPFTSWKKSPFMLTRSNKHLRHKRLGGWVILNNHRGFSYKCRENTSKFQYVSRRFLSSVVVRVRVDSDLFWCKTNEQSREYDICTQKRPGKLRYKKSKKTENSR